MYTVSSLQPMYQLRSLEVKFQAKPLIQYTNKFKSKEIFFKCFKELETLLTRWRSHLVHLKVSELRSTLRAYLNVTVFSASSICQTYRFIVIVRFCWFIRVLLSVAGTIALVASVARVTAGRGWRAAPSRTTVGLSHRQGVAGRAGTTT